jgi:hypothetical protein
MWDRNLGQRYTGPWASPMADKALYKKLTNFIDRFAVHAPVLLSLDALLLNETVVVNKLVFYLRNTEENLRRGTTLSRPQ